MAGYVHVNKVIGNLHLSPGRAFQRNSVHMHDLVPYLSGSGNTHHVRDETGDCDISHYLVSGFWTYDPRAFI